MRFGRAVEDRTDEVVFRTMRISKAQKSYPIAVRCEKYFSESFQRVLNLSFPDRHSRIEDLGRQKEKYSNGLEEGNLEVSVDPYSARHKESYLRFTVPKYEITGFSDDTTRFHKDKCILVSPKGGVMMTSGEKHLHIFLPTILLEAKESDDLLLYLLWFKSSFFLWYCQTILGEDNFFSILLRKSRRIPLPNDSLRDQLKKSQIFIHANNIILAEKKFLRDLKKSEDKNEKDEIRKLIKHHNNYADGICRLIDIEIFKCLNIPSDDAVEIYKTLSSLDVYDFEVTAKKEYEKDLNKLDESLGKC